MENQESKAKKVTILTLGKQLKELADFTASRFEGVVTRMNRIDDQLQPALQEIQNLIQHYNKLDAKVETNKTDDTQTKVDLTNLELKVERIDSILKIVGGLLVVEVIVGIILLINFFAK